MSRSSFGFIACTLLFWHSAVAAAAPRYELTWQAPAGCPNSAQVARELDELVANVVTTKPDAPVVANAMIIDVPGGHSLTLTLYDSTGAHSRQIDAPNCDELAHAAALVVALAIDPTILEHRADSRQATGQTAGPSASQVAGMTRQTAAESGASVASAAPIQPERHRQSMQATSPKSIELAQPVAPIASSRPLFLRAGLGAFGAFGTIPGQNLGLNLFGAIQGRMLRLELSASAVQAQTTSSIVPVRSASFAAYRGNVKLCTLTARTSWAVGPCAGVQVGVVSGEGHGTSENHSQHPLWAASTFGGMVELRINATSLLHLSADLETPWTHDQFRLVGEKVYEFPDISGSVGVGLAAGWY